MLLRQVDTVDPSLLPDMDQPRSLVVSSTTKPGVTLTTSQVTLRDSMDTTLRSMELMTSPGVQMAMPMPTPTQTPSTTGTTKVMPTSAMHVEDMDALFAEDMAMDTETPSLVSTDIAWTLGLVLDITTSTSETR